MKKILKLILKKLILSLILIFLFLLCISYADINIKYLGHSCFCILNKENNNLSILIDPYSYEMKYSFLKEFQKNQEFKNLNYIISSHTHFDHFNEDIFKLLKSKYLIGANDKNWYPFYINVLENKVYNFGVYHDENLGKNRRKNSILVLEYSNTCHKLPSYSITNPL